MSFVGKMPGKAWPCAVSISVVLPDGIECAKMQLTIVAKVAVKKMLHATYNELSQYEHFGIWSSQQEMVVWQMHVSRLIHAG